MSISVGVWVDLPAVRLCDVLVPNKHRASTPPEHSAGCAPAPGTNPNAPQRRADASNRPGTATSPPKAWVSEAHRGHETEASAPTKQNHCLNVCCTIDQRGAATPQQGQESNHHSRENHMSSYTTAPHALQQQAIARQTSTTYQTRGLSNNWYKTVFTLCAVKHQPSAELPSHTEPCTRV